MSNLRHLITRLAATTGLMLALIACGAGNPNTGGEQTASQPPSPGVTAPATPTGISQGVTDTQILIGNSIATSGALAPVGVPFQAGLLAYVEMVNQGGGIAGRTINYLHQDDEFNPVTGIAILEGLIQDDEVFAIVGHFGTPVIGATVEMLVDSGIPAVYFAAGTGVVYNRAQNLFPVQPVFPMEGRIMAAIAYGEFHAQRLGVIFTNDDAGNDLLSGLQTQNALMDNRLEIITAQVTPGADDVSAAVTTIMAADVDLVIIASIQGTMPQIARTLAAQGNTAPAITSYVNVDAAMSGLVYEDLGGSFRLYGTGWVDVTHPDMETFGHWVRQVASDDFSDSSFAMTGWIAGHFFVEGLRRVGDGVLNWDTFMAAMETAPIRTPFGDYIDFSQGQRHGTQTMNLAVMDGSHPIGWYQTMPFRTMQDLLGQ